MKFYHYFKAFHTDLNLNDGKCWKRMSDEYLSSQPSSQSQISLMRNDCDCASLEKKIEMHIKKSITNYRKGKAKRKFY